MKSYTLYVGTKSLPTGMPEVEPSRGIYAFSMNPDSGELAPLGLAAEATNASFLAKHPTRDVYYAIADDEAPRTIRGLIIAFKRNRQTQMLTRMNALPIMAGNATHVSVHPSGEFLFTSHFHNGAVCISRLKRDGSLDKIEQCRTMDAPAHSAAANPKRQGQPHPHWMQADPAGRYVLACDLGHDSVYTFIREENCKHDWPWTFNPAQPCVTVPTGAGVRHGAFAPDGKFFFAICEITTTLEVFRRDVKTGVMASVQSIPTLPAGFRGENKAAGIVMHPTGKFLYTSNRGANLITVFALDLRKIDTDAGFCGQTATPIQFTPSGGEFPRFITLDPTGRFLLALNKKSHNAVVFRVDEATGMLTDTGHHAVVPWGTGAVFGE